MSVTNGKRTENRVADTDLAGITVQGVLSQTKFGHSRRHHRLDGWRITPRSSLRVVDG